MILIINDEIIKHNSFEMSFYDDNFFKEFVDYLEEYHETELVLSKVEYEKNYKKYSYPESRLFIDDICICCNPYQCEIKRVIEDILEQLEIEREVVKIIV